MSQSLLAKALTPREVLLFFFAASSLFIFPLVQADYFYNDDNWRALMAGEGWREEGRILIELFYNAVSFGSKSPDLFPLPLFIATAGISLAMRSLTFFYFERPTFVHCLVVLPIWYNPFFVQQLSYRYDGPVVTLGLVALIYAVIAPSDRAWKNAWIPALLLALALSIYQVLIGFFIAMCCFEIIRLVWQGKPSEQVLRFIARTLLAIGGGVLIYYLTAYQLMTGSRQVLLALEASSLLEIQGRLSFLAHMLVGWVAGGVRPLVLSGGLLTLVGYAWAGVGLFRGPEPLWRKALLLFFYLLAIPVLLLCIPGITLFFAEYNYGARTLTAFSVLLLLMFFLSLQVLTRVHARLGLVLLIPLLAMLSFSFGHGRVLSLQKEQEAVVLASLAYDINHSPLRDNSRIYMIPELKANWLPAASGLFAAMPAQQYVLGVGYLILPESLPRAGITHVYLARDPEVITSIRRGDLSPVVSTRFYDLFVVHDSGYIFMKKLQDDPDVLPKLCLFVDIERCR
ncbi:glucosyltransferase domain-containing protein [Pseudomonas sp. NFACC07-1]|uniref:glucosyltransferase domain-containing protein n=1 Tax=Pseudomonas sp. NFACC07-1 TaxID=1566239 RepID=UPI0008B94DFE|nr:glucosyltransferase domain-containing protein [Pseudomonas sp. NFACC07-1]SEJ15388.1 Glucosyl transferase GtrII [Pseudomonas sp. NFACC07-1]